MSSRSEPILSSRAPTRDPLLRKPWFWVKLRMTSSESGMTGRDCHTAAPPWSLPWNALPSCHPVMNLYCHPGLRPGIHSLENRDSESSSEWRQVSPAWREGTVIPWSLPWNVPIQGHPVVSPYRHPVVLLYGIPFLPFQRLNGSGENGNWPVPGVSFSHIQVQDAIILIK